MPSKPSTRRVPLSPLPDHLTMMDLADLFDVDFDWVVNVFGRHADHRGGLSCDTLVMMLTVGAGHPHVVREMTEARLAHQRSLMPETVRLRQRERRRANTLRAVVIARDGLYCRYCGKRLRGSPFLDHILPISLGGKSTLENLVVACQPCNSTKAHHTMEEVGFTLRPPRGSAPDGL